MYVIVKITIIVQYLEDKKKEQKSKAEKWD